MLRDTVRRESVQRKRLPTVSASIYLTRGSTLKIRLGIVGDDAGVKANSLFSWLREDEDIHHDAVFLLNKPVEGDEMGGISDIVQLMLDPATVAAGITAVTTWLATRNTPTTIVVESGDRKITLESTAIEDPAATAARLADQIERDDQ
jgi:hypothetical protein